MTDQDDIVPADNTPANTDFTLGDIVRRTHDRMLADIDTAETFIEHLIRTFALFSGGGYVLPTTIKHFVENETAMDEVYETNPAAKAGFLVGGLGLSTIACLAQGAFYLGTLIGEVDKRYLLIPLTTNAVSGGIEAAKWHKKTLEEELDEEMSWNQYTAETIANVSVGAAYGMKDLAVKSSVGAGRAMTSLANYIHKKTPDAIKVGINFTGGLIGSALTLGLAPYAGPTAYRLIKDANDAENAMIAKLDEGEKRKYTALDRGLITGATIGALAAVCQISPWLEAIFDPVSFQRDFGFVMPKIAPYAVLATNAISWVSERFRSAVREYSQRSSNP
tara:strand:+ start:8115 stop:9116 length:1002 start_codon:yes stop_codon:yes gene_type:complete